MEKQIGIIGIGLMGHGIAKNLLLRGWKTSYLRHAGNQPTDDLDAKGAVGRPSASDLTRTSDVLILCVTGTPQVEDVLTGSGAVLDALRPGTTVIDCSTAIPSSTIRLAELVSAKGCHFVDAPMTRTPKEAEEGRLNLLVGGDAAVVESLHPLLSSFAENIFYAGGVGSGHQLKLLHNFVSLGTVTLITEAVACAAKGGVSMGALVDCLSRGGGAGVALDRLIPYIQKEQTEQLRFTVANACKDFSYYNQMADELGASHLIAAGIYHTLDGLVRCGEGNAYMPQQATLLQKHVIT
ncbi:NAD(P)-dependent oxidoreductase [Bradyrhizobium sp. CB82]|uniref:NAD(P)-dependent oxidoreductase n=1 Tax=Bradyrhizobium sp. CB82 TaxID=3039159 RepID=UPI0024B228A4|nr:NAD(P)-dependent oxidoreductase [Bradyrhizobium sp. CB82]WFU42212.1 NAD(P)-dependent oxidoreductase [Bradyrhizobium sp. CB82]